LTAVSTDVDVSYWLTDSLNEREIVAALDQLSPEERTRHARLVFAKDRRDFASAHALLRHALSAQEHRPTDEWRFVEGRNGKPQLAPRCVDRPNLSFNLAHTDGLVACVVARDADVGIDVESINRGADVLELANRYFSPIEIAHLEGCLQAERQTRFIEIWTLKEAYVKATGDGLSCRLDEFAFVFDGPTSFRFESSDGAQSAAWQFGLFKPSAHHRLAVAVRDVARNHRALIIRDHDAQVTGDRIRGGPPPGGES
jgi:4'-phosphopantetheinyl transferase